MFGNGHPQSLWGIPGSSQGLRNITTNGLQIKKSYEEAHLQLQACQSEEVIEISSDWMSDGYSQVLDVQKMSNF